MMRERRKKGTGGCRWQRARCGWIRLREAEAVIFCYNSLCPDGFALRATAQPAKFINDELTPLPGISLPCPVHSHPQHCLCHRADPKT